VAQDVIHGLLRIVGAHDAVATDGRLEPAGAVRRLAP
jgi:hypothetical protein